MLSSTPFQSSSGECRLSERATGTDTMDERTRGSPDGGARIDPEYLRLLLLYYEEEIMGQGYFDALASANADPDQHAKLVLLGQVERHAANMVVALLGAYGLRPRDEAGLLSQGAAGADRHKNLGWVEFIHDMATSYPRFIIEFENLERLAPDADRPALKRLTLHEVLTIDFAERELARDPDSTQPLLSYLHVSPDA